VNYKIELCVHQLFQAFHSLDGYEMPHLHRFLVSVTVQGQVGPNGMIVSIVDLQNELSLITNQLSGQYLNQIEVLSNHARQYPTVENLACYFLTKLHQVNPTWIIVYVTVELQSTDGKPWGSAKAYA
jgi:6-pyruvoyl-tetrahydropterin synthase